MVWEGKNVVATGRKMLGATNPLESAPGTIRGDFAVDVGRNICHGSDSVESAEVRRQDLLDSYNCIFIENLPALPSFMTERDRPLV